MAAPAAKPTTDLAQSTQLTNSQKFVQKVEAQFIAEMGSGVNWTPLQKMLAQRLYVSIDNSLAVAEQRRSSNPKKSGEPAVVWANVNMNKLTFDAMHRIALELDASQKAHIYVMPYLNGRTKKYDLDLRIGYMGQDLIRRKFSVDKILDIQYQLVFEGDEFDIDKSAGWEQPVYKPKNFFKPEGDAIGGFGYVIYEDPRRNRVFPIPYREFEKAKKASQGVEFWGGPQRVWDKAKNAYVEGEYDDKFRQEMEYKTIVHRVTNKIQVDPAKVHAASLAAIRESEDEAVLARLHNRELEEANGKVIDLNTRQEITDAEFTEDAEEATSTVSESQAETTTEEPAADIPAFDISADALKLSPDQRTFVQENAGERAAEVLARCVADGLKTWKAISDRVKEAIAGQATIPAEEEPGY